MNKTLKTALIISASLIGAIVLVGTGFVFGRSSWGMGGVFPGMMTGNFNQNFDDSRFGFGMGSGMMNSGGSYGMRSGMMGDGSSGMMGSYSGLGDVSPLTVEETRTAVESYLVSFGNDDLAIEEIMVFDNNAYAIVIEESTGIGAFELLVDPVTKAVFPEYGPNMMWNIKYGMMSEFGGFGMMGPGMMMGSSGFGPGNMMGNSGFNNNAETPDISAELSVSADDAAEAAQNYLDTYYPGVKVSDETTAFYGYYTIDLEQDGKIIGMLSVNGFTRQVFPHTWHGDFIEMNEM